MTNSYPSAPVRNFSLLVNLIIVFLVHNWIGDGRISIGGLDDLWLISAIALWTISLVGAPWFESPKDVIANSVTVGVALLTVDLSTVSSGQSWLIYWKIFGVCYCLLVGITAALSQFLRDSGDTEYEASVIRRFSRAWGSGIVLYTILALFSLGGAYAHNPAALTGLTFFWIAVVVGNPVVKCIKVASEWDVFAGKSGSLDVIGKVSRVDDPNVVRVALEQPDAWKSDNLHVLALSDDSNCYVLPLFTQIQGREVIGTGICLDKCTESLQLDSGSVARVIDQERTRNELLSDLCGHENGIEIAGFVIEGSTIARIKFEIAPEAGLEEGDIVFTNLRGQDVYYQIVAAETSEEVILQSPRGTQVVYAIQIGAFSEVDGFKKYSWLPAMNQLIFTAKGKQFPKAKVSEHSFPIGKLPGIELEVLADLHDLIEYHSAILGITGTGKTEVAFSIIEEAVKQGVKVFAVDFTKDYGQRLAKLKPEFLSPTKAQSDDLEAKFFAVETGEFKAGAEKKALKTAVDALQESTKAQVDSFLKDTVNNLAIFELPGISNTRATLALTELYLTTIMDWAKANRSEQKILIVLEEAHTIVPETAGTGMDFETKRVVDRIGQIALQGRKYGVGLQVITQRTALVSKTILSQCNTFFTHSLIDQTSLKFLESVYSSEHTKIIPNLKSLHFLASGKAVNAERPIMLEREFDPKIKAASDELKRPIPIHTDGAEIVEPEKGGAIAPDLDDEIPF